MNTKNGKSQKRISNNSSNIINNELYEENYGYDVPSTYRNNDITDENNYQIKDPNIERLQLKIEEQEKIIYELNNYKYLCEKRIKQLNPGEILPITPNSLNNKNKINQQKNNDNNLYNQNINKKYELLNEKFEKLLNDYNEIINNNNIHDTSSNTINVGNNNDKYKLMKEKYKKVKAENKKIIELLKEETKACETQKNIIDILKQAINNDICKNSNLKNYITVENIVDFTQLKMEIEQYRKELVLSQALVNSLKSEIEQLNKEKGEHKFDLNNKQDLNNYNFSENNRNEDHNLIMSENLSLKSTLNSQAQLIKELMDENQNLKKLVDEATIKLNDCITNKNEDSINNEKLNKELNSKDNEIKQYEDKFIYFNEYIATIKSIFMNFQENLPKFIGIYNKLANEDLNSLLSNSFSQSIIKLNNRINQLNKLEKFNLETNIESDLTNIIMELLQIVNNEFISVYEKVFQTNCYYKESNIKIEELLLKLKDNEIQNENNLKKINDINDLLNNEKKNMIECQNEVEEYKVNLNISQIEKDNLNKKLEYYIDDKNIIINCYYMVIKAISLYNESLAQLIRETINIIETKSKLFNEKEIIMEQLTKNKIKDINRNKIYQNNPEINKMVTQEQITLQNLINEFENKIKEKEQQLMENKENINQCLLELQNRPIIPKGNNGNNNEYNYNYYIKTNENNGIGNFRENMNKFEEMNFNEVNNNKNINKNGTNFTYALMNKNNYNQKNINVEKNENDINSQK